MSATATTTTVTRHLSLGRLRKALEFTEARIARDQAKRADLKAKIADAREDEKAKKAAGKSAKATAAKSG